MTILHAQLGRWQPKDVIARGAATTTLNQGEGSRIVPWQRTSKLPETVLRFDLGCMSANAELLTEARDSGFDIASVGGCIAAIATANVCTRDTGRFGAAGVAVINPWLCRGR